MADDDIRGSTRRGLLRGIGGATGTLGLAATAGCVGGGGGGTGNDSSGGGSDDGTTELLFWTESFNNPANAEWEEWYRTTLQENHPVELSVSASTYADRRQNFLTGARQGSPDYIEGILNHLTEFQQADLLEPMTEYVNALDFWEGFTDGALKAVTYKDEVWGMPWTGNGRALLYRNDVFEELGLEPPKTVSEFLEVGRAINEQRDDMVAFHNCTKVGSSRGFQEFMSHVYQHDDNLYQVNNESWEVVPGPDALATVLENWYYEVWASDNPLANPDQLGTGWQVNDYGYLTGDYAMIECGPWILDMPSEDAVEDQEAAEERLYENTTVTHLPYDSNGERGTFLEVKPVMVNKHSSNKELAKEAVGLYCSPDSFRTMKETGLSIATPLHTEISTTIERDNLAAFEEVMETGRPLAKVPWGSTRDALYPEIQGVAYGEKEPQAAGETLHQKFTDIAKDLEV